MTSGSENKRKDIANEFEKVKNIFSGNFNLPEEKKSEVKKSEKTKKISSFKDLRHLDSKDTKDTTWEQVKPSSKIQHSERNTRAVKPSASDHETNFGGKGIVPKSGNLIGDPFVVESKKDSKLTKILMQDSAKKKQERADKKNRKHSEEARAEWETVQSAKKTSDIYAGNMGFTPNRSAFKQDDIKKVNLEAVRKEVEKNNRSAVAGKEAARLKSDLDNILRSAMDKKNSEAWDWEKEAQEKLDHNASKDMNIVETDVKLSKDFTPFSNKKADLDLSGIFKTPDFEAKERVIKKKSDIKAKIKTNKDDRSWEKVNKPKKNWR